MAFNLGEFELIDRFLSRIDSAPPDLVIPPGDDCAGIRIRDETLLLVTTDLLVEDVHFTFDSIRPRELGWKTMAVNISDIAAMGGRPSYGFLSIAIPGHLDLGTLDDFMEGLHGCCKTFEMVLAGGDTTSSHSKLFINLCVLGTVSADRCLTRTGAVPGDIIQVSGPLGGSAAGLRMLLDGTPRKELDTVLANAHFQPQPRVEAAAALSTVPGVHAMIDISDGLVQDLGHICRNSGTGAIVDAGKIPLFNEALHAFCGDRNRVLALALSGGEDYELCWTVAPDHADLAIATAASAGAPNPVTIGHVVPGSNVKVLENGIDVTPLSRGFDHFNAG